MKVLHVIQRYPPAIGGSEQWCAHICRYLVDKRIDSRVATMNLYNIAEFGSHPALEKIHRALGRFDYDQGVSIERYPLWTLYSNRISAWLIRNLLKIGFEYTEIGEIFRRSPHSFQMYSSLYKQAKEADIVHLYTLPYFHNILGYYIAKILKKKIVITPFFHAGHKDYEKKIFFKIIRGSDAVIALTEYEKDYLARTGVDRDKIYVTGCFLEEEKFSGEDDLDGFREKIYKKYGIKEDSKKIIFIGIKLFYKGINILIEAAKAVADEETSELVLFLVGVETDEFRQRYPDLGKSGRLKVIDFATVREVEKNYLIRLSDMLVLASQYESFGIVFLEAWQHGKPVIGSKSGSIPEVIKGAGLTVKYGDIRDLKLKIKELLSDKALAKRLGANGKQKIQEQYSRRCIGNKVLKVYNNLADNNRRVLIVSQLFPPYTIGGSELVAYKQAKMLKKMGFDVKVYAGRRNDQGSRYALRKKRKDFDITWVDLHGDDFLHDDFRNLNKGILEYGFRKLLYELRPDIVHFHNIYALSPNLIDACHEEDIPALITVHDYWAICNRNILLDAKRHFCSGEDELCSICEPYQNPIKSCGMSIQERNQLVMRSLRKASLLISPSAYLAEKFIKRGVPRDKIRVINNGINLGEFKLSKKKSKKIRFAYIGQVIEHKGIENLLKAISFLDDKEQKQISVLIVGSGIDIYVDFCKRLAKELIPTNTVTFYGGAQNEKVAGMFRDIDAVIVPSVWSENSPVSIMEALASGTPVLASEIGGIPELVQDNLTGFLHKYDDPDSLTENFRKIIRRPAILKEMQEACVRKAKENNLSRQVSKIADEYKRILEFQS